MANSVAGTVVNINGNVITTAVNDFPVNSVEILGVGVPNSPTANSRIRVIAEDGSFTDYYCTETVQALWNAANVSGVKLVLVTVTTYNTHRQLTSFQAALPASGISVRPSVPSNATINAIVLFKGIRYAVVETAPAILAAANS